MTPIGQFLRRERQERGQLLAHMASALGVSSPYLSQIETGKRPIPEGFEDKVARILGLSMSDAKELERAAALSRSEYQIGLHPDAAYEDRALAYDLAMGFARLSPEKKQKIRKIIGENHHA